MVYIVQLTRHIPISNVVIFVHLIKYSCLEDVHTYTHYIKNGIFYIQSTVTGIYYSYHSLSIFCELAWL